MSGELQTDTKMICKLQQMICCLIGQQGECLCLATVRMTFSQELAAVQAVGVGTSMLKMAGDTLRASTAIGAVFIRKHSAGIRLRLSGRSRSGSARLQGGLREIFRANLGYSVLARELSEVAELSPWLSRTDLPGSTSRS